MGFSRGGAVGALPFACGGINGSCKETNLFGPSSLPILDFDFSISPRPCGLQLVYTLVYPQALEVLDGSVGNPVLPLLKMILPPTGGPPVLLEVPQPFSCTTLFELQLGGK